MFTKRRAQKKIASLVAGGALLATWVTAAVWHGGIPAQHVDLTDSGVWVTNTRSQIVGHVNYPSMTLDAQLRTPSGAFDVAQQGDEVLFHDLSARSIAMVDPASSTFGKLTSLAQASVSTLGGGYVASYDPTSGTVWKAEVGKAAHLGTNDTVAATSLPQGDVVLTDTGTLHGASPITRKWIAGDHRDVLPADIRYDHTLQVSAVGDHSLVLDTTSGMLYIDGAKRQAHIRGKDLALQLPGPQADFALIANDKELIEVNLETASIEAYPAQVSGRETQSGAPARPVFHQGCAYSAWSGTGVYMRECPGHQDDQVKQNDSLRDSRAAVFRTNRDAIVLNDTVSGRVWLPDKNMQIVDDWDTTLTDHNTPQKADQRSHSQSNEPANPQTSAHNRVPLAEPDAFGVRAGQITTLPVLLNDSDPDGDVLTVSLLKEPSFGRVVPIRAGRAFQIDTPASASGRTTFTYEVNDGRGGRAQTTVAITVHPPEQNLPPRQVVSTVTRLAPDGRISAQLLDDWIDPDGDPIYLANVGEEDKLNITWNRTGSVELANAGHASGTVSLPIAVSDGLLTGDGALAVQVASGEVAPTANADSVSLTLGNSTVFSPLANDVDPNGDPLRLVSLGEIPQGIVANMDPASGNISLEALSVGTFYLPYSITDGKNSAVGKVRIDVTDAQQDGVPIPETDLAVAGDKPTVIDPLANDWDPGSGVLTVTDVRAPKGVSVLAMGQQYVRISANAGLTAPAQLTYTVSNGTASAQGTIVVFPSGPPHDEAPIAIDDTLTVRSGDVGTVDVVANDISPDALQVTSVGDIPAAAGEVFFSEHDVRVKAGKPGQYAIAYTVTDEHGRSARARVNLRVLSPGQNAVPHPLDLVARTRAGGQVTINVPLNGIDSDGDSVELTSIDNSAKLGVATAQADGTITYRADADAAGTDVFTYQVTDRGGKSAQARVRVGIAPASDHNQAPIPGPDRVTVRPRTQVEVPVLANDVDPDFDPIALAIGTAHSHKDDVVVTEKSGGQLAFTAPEKPGTYLVHYDVVDSRGGRATGLLTVIVNPNAPKLAPIPADDFPQVTGAPQQITVDVLRNDRDPDGAASQLKVSTSDPAAKVRDQRLVIDLAPTRRPVVYTVTDADGLSGSAVVWVPGLENPSSAPQDDQTPHLIRGAAISLRPGQSLTSDINSYIDPDVTIDGQVTPGTGMIARGHGTNLTVTASDGDARNTYVSVGVVSKSGKRATISIPVLIRDGNRAPIISGAAVEVVTGGEGISLDLGTIARDPDDDQLSYTIESVPDGIAAEVNGHTLRVDAHRGARVGRAGTIRIAASDGKATTSGNVSVSVIEQTAPRLSVGTTARQVRRGQSVTIDVSDLVHNPFPTPPRIVSADGGGAVRVAVSGTRLTVTPTQVGEFPVRFTLRDATGDASRDVSSIVYLDAVDVPDAPREVTAVLQGHTALVSFVPGGLGGSSLRAAVITDLTQGDHVRCTPGSVCRMPARIRGVAHQFHVVLYNDVGASAPTISRPLQID
ncbi:Ig-like domain-containing protein [Arcanobacterium canis]|uniref:Ig-like domain-containing protein n=1 Tax=Arcanobacterium canis TaxID=999183 RepID=A0ABY8FXW0_9ACTO|nr:Ig-like domain-containing protein [Arcanobacterium canis]WFM83350.1 Ig-like domain-containing protein [Arcanobacterium canis]